MGYVFLSYSSKNIETAINVKNVLIKNGIEVWMAPECIEAGKNYTETIPAAIEGCFAFVLVLSAESQISQWVTRELDMALNRNRQVIPFHIDSSKMTDQYDFMLAGCQRIEAFSRMGDAFKDLLVKLNSLDQNDRFVHEDGTVHAEAGVLPQNDESLEVVVKTINADKKSDNRRRKWYPVIIAIAGVSVCLIVGIVIIVINVAKAVNKIDSGNLIANVSGSNVIIDKEDGESVTITLSGSGKEDAEDDGEDGEYVETVEEDEDDEEDDASDLSDLLAGSGLTGGSGSGSSGTSISGEDLLGFLAGLGGADLSDLLGVGVSTDEDDLTKYGYSDLFKVSSAKYVNAEFKDTARSAGNVDYEDSVVLITDGADASAGFTLDKDYSQFVAALYCPEELKDTDGTWKVILYLDEKPTGTYIMSADSEGELINVSIKGVKTIRIEVVYSGGKETGVLFTNAYIL